jgi:ComF family protein
VGGVDVPNGLGLCFAATEFRGAAETWIVRFKYPQPGILGLDPGPRRAAEALIRRSARAVPGPAPDLIVPVPLHPRRLRRRGFNPAGLLAAEVVRARGGRLDPTGLVRVRDTPSQTGLGRRERRRNVDGAFRAPRAVPRRVWLVDDVVTTGATLAACGRALRDAGALDVTAVCAAWTPPRAHVDTSSA